MGCLQALKIIALERPEYLRFGLAGNGADVILGGLGARLESSGTR